MFDSELKSHHYIVQQYFTLISFDFMDFLRLVASYTGHVNNYNGFCFPGEIEPWNDEVPVSGVVFHSLEDEVEISAEDFLELVILLSQKYVQNNESKRYRVNLLLKEIKKSFLNRIQANFKKDLETYNDYVSCKHNKPIKSDV